MRINRTLRNVLCLCCTVGLMSVLPACSMFRGGEEEAPATETAATDTTEQKAADPKAGLEDVVRRYVAAAAKDQDEAQRRLVKREPYFFKEYDVYPDGGGMVEPAFRETESRTAPYVADVNLAKQRFATELKRKKDEAREDTNYFRETGTETLTYEYRNGKWLKVGSLFVIEKREENVNGEWVPVKEEVDRALAAEGDEKGWLGRFWEGLTGR